MRAGVIATITAVAFQAVGIGTAQLPGGDVSTHELQFGSEAWFANIAGHAAIGCASAEASGQKCGPAALAGAITSAAGPDINKGNYVANLVENTVLGGAAAVAGGGKFANGAITGAFGYLFNNCAANPKGCFPDPMSGVDLNDSQEVRNATITGGIIIGGTVAVGGAAWAASAFVFDAVVTIGDAVATLPEGMTLAQFGQLAGFQQGLVASSQASTLASAEAIANLQAAGVSAEAIATFQQFYAGVALENAANLSAVHRAALLLNILRAY